MRAIPLGLGLRAVPSLPACHIRPALLALRAHCLSPARTQVEPLLQQMAVQQETDLAVAEAMRSLRLVGSGRPSASQGNTKAPGTSSAATASTAAAPGEAGVSVGAAATSAAAAAKAPGGLDSSSGRGFGSAFVSAVDIALPELCVLPGDSDAASQPADAAAKVQCRMSGSGLGGMASGAGAGGGGSMCGGGGGLHAGLISSEAESESCGTAGTTTTGLTALTAASSPGASLPQRLAVFATSSSGCYGAVGLGAGGIGYGALGGGGGGVGHTTADGGYTGCGGGGADMMDAGPGRARGGSEQQLCGGAMGEAGEEAAALDMMVG